MTSAAPTAFALNCTLTPSASGPSSTGKLIDEVLAALAEHGVESAGHIRLADHTVAPGVSSDEGGDDEWPELRRRILDADVFVLGTPIWMGHPSSHAQRVLERLDALLGETDDDGRTPADGKVAVVAVVGNEDGAHHVAAELFQGLNDVGFAIPANGMTYWVGEAMQTTDYQDVPRNERTDGATRLAATNAAHLAGALRSFRQRPDDAAAAGAAAGGPGPAPT